MPERITRACEGVACFVAFGCLCACGGGSGGDGTPAPPPAFPSLGVGPANCINGMAGDFPCDGVSLHKRVPLGTLGGRSGNDVADLDHPEYLYAYEATTAATDHNLYVAGQRIFQANYSAGLRVLEFGDLSDGELAEIGFLDTRPDSSARGFEGAWSVYPYFPSEIIVISDTLAGLFIVSLDAPPH